MGLAFLRTFYKYIISFKKLFTRRRISDTQRTELDGVIRNQQQSISDLREAEGTADGIGQAVTAGLGEVQSAICSNEELGAGNVRTAELIGECQDILRGIRQRGTIEER